MWERQRRVSVGISLTFDVWDGDGPLPLILETVTRIIGHEMEVDVWFGGRVPVVMEQLSLPGVEG